MFKIIGADGQTYGPVTADELCQWISSGRANAQTMAQLEGTPDWRPLSSFPEFAEALAARQTLSSAAPPSANALPPLGGVDTEALSSEVILRDYTLNITACISRSWELLMQHFWLLVGAAFVIWLIAGAVPFLGGVLYGGLYWLSLKLIRGQEAEFGDAFAGFNLALLSLFLAGLIKWLLVSIGIALCILPGIYLSVIWTFAIPLIIDKRMDFWPAMELSRRVVSQHWWQVFGLLLMNVLILLLGTSACFVGMFVALPVTIGAVSYAYEDIFGARPGQTA